MKKSILWIVGIVLVVGCATTDANKMSPAPASQTGFLKGYYDKLELGPEGGASCAD